MTNPFSFASTQENQCLCFIQPSASLLIERDLGMDDHYAEISIWRCTRCGQYWLRYFFELEAFSASGRWYLGAIADDVAARLTAVEAKDIIENLDWYYFGGSYFDGRTGKVRGALAL